ncbi:OmpA family protein [Candidatus Venteria ishoeyi]|uniref:Photosystem I P700 chlorophyll a apoprotein A2 n=1 Tax=Candidatus Venteria ishoeyi TaxID=1899563 RepID=A0A1H6F2W1_9GAMM|nr:OmpA family protein [Candidatus Venteria ishoeyi]SEH04460.1 Photosystem I P700 chlorophyll a apoprotein A2 [Candidatus Venteria ishoeyi]
MPFKTITIICISILAVSACTPAPVSERRQSSTGAISINDTPRGVSVTIAEGILFQSGKYSLQEDSEPVLARLAKLIQQTDKAIAVEGHTDNIGDRNYNLRLSQRRANTVIKALKAHGIKASRLHAKGYGMGKPVTDNATPAGRQYNRRVEVYMLGERKRNLTFTGAGSDGYFDSTFSSRVRDLENQFRRLPGIGWFF